MSENKTDPAAEAAQEPKNIPPANLPEELLPVYDWYMGKGKDQLLVAAIALVIAVVAFSIVKYRDGQNAEASFALTGAEGVESLEGLNTKYGRTAVAPVIALRLARAYFDVYRLVVYASYRTSLYFVFFVLDYDCLFIV